jgi:hypothetical protein
MLPPPHMTCMQGSLEERGSMDINMFPPPHMTCMHPPPHTEDTSSMDINRY